MQNNNLYINKQKADKINNTSDKIKIRKQFNNSFFEAYTTARYEIIPFRLICPLSNYLKYFLIMPIIFLAIFIINLWFFNIFLLGVFSLGALLVSSFLFFRKLNEYENLKSYGNCYTLRGLLLILDQDSKNIMEYRIKGECPIHGCKQNLQFVKTFENQEGYQCAIACHNSPSHYFRFNFSGIGEQITLTPIPKAQTNN